MHRNFLLLARGLALVGLAALALGLGGCGKRQFDVTGKVTYNGEIVSKADGQIVFVGPNGSQVMTAIGKDGAYKATKVAAGLNRVAIYYKNPAFQKQSRPKGKPDPNSRPANTPLFLTPESYASAETSNLEVNVTKTTEYNVDMKGPPIP